MQKLKVFSGGLKKERAGRKPGSVLHSNDVTGRAVIYLGRLLPDASSGSLVRNW